MADKEEGTVSKELSEMGRKLAQARRIVDSTCEWCGKPITGTKKRKYCSASHAVMAHRKRRRERDNKEDT